jgi:magnesium-protoporphyrin IX monomethyl ester (oxidative) cyclase
MSPIFWETKKEMKIALVNMPFAMTCLPSLGLAQLEAVLHAQFGEQVRVTTHYLNLDFAKIVGDTELYHHPYSPHGFMTDAGEWLFSAVAFPEMDDNTDAYVKRYYYGDSPSIVQAREFIVRQRAELEACLETLIDRHQLADADIVGFTLLFSQTVASMALARLLKRRNPRLITVLGGSACEGEMGQVYVERVRQVDYCFSGPALVSFPHFIRCLLAGDIEGCNRLNGVFSKTNRILWGDGRAGALAPLGDDLDINENIIPEYSGFLDTHASIFPNPQRTPVLLFETSRGCIRAQGKVCRFCGLNGLNARYRQMQAEHALCQIHALWRYVPRSRFMMAVDNLMPPIYPREVFSKLSPPAGVAMRYEVRSDLSASDIQALCRGGVTWLQPGIESLSTATLILMRKGITAFNNVRFLKECTRYPVTLEWNLLIGTPGEPETVYEKYLRDIPLMMHLPPPTGAFSVMFVKYSDYYNHQEEHHLSLQPQEFYAYIFPFSPEDIQRVAYRYVDTKKNPDWLDTWLDALNALIRCWRQRWDGMEGKLPVQLCLTETEKSFQVYDTRSGDAVWSDLTPFATQLLQFLEVPATVPEMMAYCSTDEARILEHLTFFRAHGWVFEEDGKSMSLVCNFNGMLE